MKKKWKCEGCSKFFRNLAFMEGKKLCYYCRKKTGNLISGPCKFDDYLLQGYSMKISLTKNQWELFNKRMLELRLCQTEYLRALILSDLERQKLRGEK